jgi:hypothetical protein
VPPEGVRVWEDAFWELHVSAAGREFTNLRPRRVFPLSGRADYVSFLDEKGREVLLLAHPRRLDRESRHALEKALERTYYTAKILRVDGMREAMGVTQWDVLTDHGHARFEVVDREQHIRHLRGGRYVIADVDGNRFEIEDVRQLDKRSQDFVYHET